MDPNPSRFPILSYVMSKLPSIGGGTASRRADEGEYDIEQPRAAAAKRPAEVEMQLPQITDPEVLKKLRVLISHVSQAREVLEALGERPDHESVDLAKEKVREIQTKLDEMRDDVAGDADVAKKKRKEVEEERELYKSIIVVDEMHEEYEKLLKESEEKLVGIFEEQKGGGGGEGKEKVEEVEVSEEVVRVLQEAEAGREVERGDFAGRQLKVLPEAFGRIKGLVVLNLSNNQLQVDQLF